MSPRTVRRIVVAVCVGGIAGMIAGSIADNNGFAMTAGLVTAIAVLCLIVTTAVAGPATAVASEDEEALAEHLESQIDALTQAGAEERAVRVLVGTAVELGRLRSTRQEARA